MNTCSVKNTSNMCSLTELLRSILHFPTWGASPLGWLSLVTDQQILSNIHFSLCSVSLFCSTECARLLKLKDADGKVFLYSGALKNKKIPNGEGTAWYTTYKGKWANGLWDKKGVITFPGGASFRGKFKNGKPVSGALTNVKVLVGAVCLKDLLRYPLVREMFTPQVGLPS